MSSGPMIIVSLVDRVRDQARDWIWDDCDHHLWYEAGKRTQSWEPIWVKVRREVYNHVNETLRR